MRADGCKGMHSHFAQSWQQKLWWISLFRQVAEAAKRRAREWFYFSTAFRPRHIIRCVSRCIRGRSRNQETGASRGAQVLVSDFGGCIPHVLAAFILKSLRGNLKLLSSLALRGCRLILLRQESWNRNSQRKLIQLNLWRNGCAWNKVKSSQLHTHCILQIECTFACLIQTWKFLIALLW